MTNFERGKTYYGFKLKASEKVNDINSVAYIFEHEKSGARLLYLKNSDKNKVFYTAFATAPEDDCGTPHILEHSVLCGSKKYPVKDPFIELAKGSMNTYLNAVTFADKTVYPVASCNDKDFSNLVDVYLDAVYNPNIYRCKEIFMQEGWHYELENEEAPLEISGVVYNEMKGAVSDPEDILESSILKSLLPDTPYRFNSGGEPDFIPDLTYEKFLEFHKKHYNPSNSYMYLYGDMDAEKYLKKFDGEYLSNFEKASVQKSINRQKPFDGIHETTEKYSVSGDEDEDNGAYFALSYVTGASYNAKESMSLDLLCEILLGNNSSPLKKALTEAGISSEITGWFDSSTLDTVFSIVAKKASAREGEKFRKIVSDTLEDIVKTGLDKKLITACLNSYEFYMREEDYGSCPKGLVYGFNILKSWLHGKSPLEYLKIWDSFNEIKEKAGKGYFEDLIQERLIKNKHFSFITLLPEAGLQIKKDRAEAKRLDKEKMSFGNEEINKTIASAKRLAKYQSASESEKNRKKIPLLSLSDITKKADYFAYKKKAGNDFPVVLTPADTNDIVYVSLAFDTKKVPDKYIPYLGILNEVLGRIDTEKYAYSELPNEINTYTGGISSSLIMYSDTDFYRPMLTISGRALERNCERMFELMGEIIRKSRYDNEESLKKIIKETLLELKDDISRSGHISAITRCLSFCDEAYAFTEKCQGSEYYRFLKKAIKRLDSIYPKLIKTAEYVFTKDNFTFLITCSEKNFDLCKGYAENVYDSLNDKKYRDKKRKILKNRKSEAITTSGKVQYNAKGFLCEPDKYKYSGKVRVLKTILSLDYLWNKIRVEGGAYGCGFNMTKRGNLCIYSYRDPNILRTYKAYDNVWKYLEDFKADKRDMTKYIIGTVSGMDRPKTFRQIHMISAMNYFCGITEGETQKERDEILSCSESDIREYSKLLKTAMENGRICTIGNESRIKKAKDLYEKITKL